jgi:alginate O-acetyltransferase complex protein AlgI
MSFATPVFLWMFMPAVLVAYFVLPARHRNAILALASLVFYAYGAHAQVFLLLGCIVVNYVAGARIEATTDTRLRNAILATTVVADVGVLAYWKYAGFLSREVSSFTSLFGGHGSGVISIALPIGISFFTFHLLSYVIDVWRERSHALRRPLDFAAYIAMFPQLIAGPIVRYHEIADQLAEIRDDRWADLAAGFPRFVYGLGKKVIVADSIGPIANAVFDQPAGHLTTASAWLGTIAYAMQLYFDFSGYSDMAIGLAAMFGFRFPENFNRPYSASSITDFWRRWHMSLSRWFRDYLYIPLGGNQGSAFATYRNLLLVFALTGLWHGAAWTFLIWGLYHGAWLIYERSRPRLRAAHGASALGVGAVARMRARTFLIVMFGWVLFRAPDIPHALGVYRAMFTPRGLGLDALTSAAWSHERRFVLLVSLVVLLLPRDFVIGKVLDAGRSTVARVGRLVVVFGLAPLVVVLVVAGTFSPFLYFQF